MAYSQGSGDALVALQALLLANGWQLVDELVAGADLVFKAGLVYVRVTRSSPNLNVTCYQWWDAAGHVGYNPAAGGLLDATNYWLWTDGSALVIVTESSGTYSGAYAGALHRLHDGNVATIQAPVAAGSGVVIAVDQVPDAPWPTGRKLVVLDQSTANVAGGVIPEQVVGLTAKGTTSITVDTIGDFAAGAVIGKDPQPVGVSEFGVVADATFYMTNGLTSPHPGSPGHAFSYHLPFPDFVDERAPLHIHSPVYVVNAVDGESEVRGYLRGVFRIAGAGVAADDTSVFGNGTYVALPVTTAGAFLLVPTF